MHNVAQVEQHVRRALGATDEVEAGGDDLADLAAARESALHGQLVEVERRVRAVLVEAQLAAHLVDEPLAVLQRDLLGLAHRVLQAVDRDAARVVGAHELADHVAAAARALLDLHLGHDDRLLEHIAAARAVGDAARPVHLDLVRVALFAHLDVARHDGMVVGYHLGDEEEESLLRLWFQEICLNQSRIFPELFHGFYFFQINTRCHRFSFLTITELIFSDFKIKNWKVKARLSSNYACRLAQL